MKTEEDGVPINTATGHMHVTPSDGSVVGHGGEPYVCDQLKTEEDEVHINTATDDDNANKVKDEITEDLCLRRKVENSDDETRDSISSDRTDVTSSAGSVVEHRGGPYAGDHVKTEEDEVPINTATGHLEENPGTGLLNVKEEDETDDMNSHQPEIHWTLPDDEDNADIVKVEITEDLCMRHQLKAPNEESSDSTSSADDDNPRHDQHADASFSLFETHKSHMRNVCSECGKRFTRKSSLVNHQKTHSGERPFSCSECGKCFAEKSNLIKHQSIHTGEKAFSCSYCGKCFAWKSDLNKHLKIHTGEKAFSCSECGKCFTRKSDVRNHQIIHTGEKPFSCSQCGKCFNRKSNLISHQKSHTGKKAFSCSECGKCYVWKSDLVYHQKYHTGEKGFSCSHCGKYFTWKSDFIAHQKSHTGEKSLSCSE